MHKEFSFIKLSCHTRKQTLFNIVTFIRKSFIRTKYMKSVMLLFAIAHIMDIGHIMVSITSEYITLLSTKKGFKFPGMMVLTVLF